MARAFLSSNFKYVLIAIVVLIGQGVVWYSSQFWALFSCRTYRNWTCSLPALSWASPWSWRPLLRHSGRVVGPDRAQAIILGGMAWPP